MAYSSMVSRAAGYIVKAASDWNIMVTNFAAIWVGTTNGDIDYYTGASAKARIAIGNAGESLTVVSGVPTWKAFYPVGSIYMSTLSTNPGTLLGFGTWAAFAAGRVLVGLNSGDTAFDTVEETGGSKTHTLTTDEIPAHTHTYNNYATVQNSDSGVQATAYSVPTSSNSGSTGGGSAHNNLQPYVVVYMWKRTA